MQLGAAGSLETLTSPELRSFHDKSGGKFRLGAGDRQCKVRVADPRSSTMLHPTDNRGTADVSQPAGVVAASIDMAGVYLTDEVFLYRVVGSAANAVDEVVELEDCYGLDVVPVPVSHLRSRRLRVVTPAVEG